MSNTSALGAARSRWWVIALFMAIGAALAALPTPDRVGQESQATRYTATHTLLLNNPALAQSTTAAVSPSQVTLFATTGDVPERVKEIIGFAGNAAQLASTVAVTFDVNTGALTFATTQDTATQAELVANTFAEQTNTFIAQRQDQVYQDRLAASLTRLQVASTSPSNKPCWLIRSSTAEMCLRSRPEVSASPEGMGGGT